MFSLRIIAPRFTFLSLFSEEEVAKVHSCILTACSDCHVEVSIMERKTRIIQQVELIEVSLIREEHRSYPVWRPKSGKINYMRIMAE